MLEAFLVALEPILLLYMYMYIYVYISLWAQSVKVQKLQVSGLPALCCARRTGYDTKYGVLGVQYGVFCATKPP